MTQHGDVVLESGRTLHACQKSAQQRFSRRTCAQERTAVAPSWNELFQNFLGSSMSTSRSSLLSAPDATAAAAAAACGPSSPDGTEGAPALAVGGSAAFAAAGRPRPPAACPAAVAAGAGVPVAAPAAATSPSGAAAASSGAANEGAGRHVARVTVGRLAMLCSSRSHSPMRSVSPGRALM